MENGPIFIAGVSYSGKTQLRLMLNSHPKIHITRRTYFWRRYFNRFGDLNLPVNLNTCLDVLFASKQVQELETDRESVRRELEAGQVSYTRLFSTIHKQHARALGKSRWGVQQSFVECDADMIFSEIPSARILHVVRNPIDRIGESLSRSSNRAGKVGWETALWQLSTRWAGRNKRRYPERYSLVHWERLTAGPEEVMAEVCAFLGEEYYHGLADTVLPEEPDLPNHSSLSMAEKAFIERWTVQEMSSLGYSRQRSRLPLGSMLSLALLGYPLNSAGAILSRILRQKKLSTSRTRMEMKAA